MERRLLLEEMRKRLLGPSDPNESLQEIDYITGILERYNAESIVSSEIISPSLSSNEDAGDPGNHIVIDSDFQGRVPSSMGLTFIVGGSKCSIDICVTWGEYRRDPDTGKSIRTSISKIIDGYELDTSIGASKRVFLENSIELVSKVSKSSREGVMISLFLVNRSSSRIYQSQIRVNLQSGSDLLPMKVRDSWSDKDTESLDFLYRNRKGYCRGHLVSTTWKWIDPEGALKEEELSPYWADGFALSDRDRVRFTCPSVRTEYLPMIPVVSPDLNSWPGFSDREPVLEAKKLAECKSGKEAFECLSPLIEGYSSWIRQTFGDLSGLEKYDSVILRHKEECMSSLRRIKEGVYLIKDNDLVRAAFQFSNMAIHKVNVWKGSDEFCWRPFQLAFILQNVPGLSSRTHDDRKTCDLLWFPTGGGKTEAYLGLASFIMSFRRLLHAPEEGSVFHPGAGVSVISRYTLRLLTIQQFRRGSSVVTACELLRVLKTPRGTGWRPEGCGLSGDYPWGMVSFSIGLWAGGKVTPNQMRTRTVMGGTQIKGALRGENNEKGLFNERDNEHGEPGQILSCPCCNSVLSLSSGGLSGGKSIEVWITMKDDPGNLKVISDRISSSPEVDDCDIVDLRVLQDASFVIGISLTPKRDITNKIFERIIFEGIGRLSLHCFSPSRPGYFDLECESGRADYSIICPNPNCELNIGVDWVDRTPSGSRVYPKAFRLVESRCPIPALTVDEEIYSRCPSMIISTVDKFAQMAYKTECGNLFGNVEGHHPKYGYVRDTLGLYRDDFSLDDLSGRDDWFDLRDFGFIPPDFILQDELHLIDGPLGSVVGLYEIAIKELTRISGDLGAKYISSTATARNAVSQIASLYGLETMIFPPPGIDVDDSFWSRSSMLSKGEIANPVTGASRPSIDDEIVPGRLYVGLCALGQSMQWTTVTSWSSVLQYVYERRSDSDSSLEHLDRYWTLVGYFNAIRELAGAKTVVAQDIIGRIGYLSNLNGSIARENSYLDTMDLSSRTPSVELPSMLSQLEEKWGTDVVITTSMFGTGVDIDRLGLMFVIGQPKTASSYIQATGRVGRSGGGLVVTMLRGGRPRDLNHYEFFSSFHNELYKHVEPVSVYPFSVKAVQRALGPVIVSLLRQANEVGGLPISKKWRSLRVGEAGWLQSESEVGSLKDIIVNILSSRNMAQPKNRKMSNEELESFILNGIKSWRVISDAHPELLYNENTLNKVAKSAVVLGSEAHELRGLDVVFERAPNSMRDVESTINFESRGDEFHGN